MGLFVVSIFLVVLFKGPRELPNPVIGSECSHPLLGGAGVGQFFVITSSKFNIAFATTTIAAVSGLLC